VSDRRRPDRPIYVLRLRPAPGRDPIRSLRTLLKFAWRQLGLRALEIYEDSLIQTICRRDARRRVAFNSASLRKTTMGNARQYAGSRYVKLADLHGKPPLHGRISYAKEEERKENSARSWCCSSRAAPSSASTRLASAP
jgi:hypothetical protein